MDPIILGTGLLVSLALVVPGVAWAAGWGAARRPHRRAALRLRGWALLLAEAAVLAGLVPWLAGLSRTAVVTGCALGIALLGTAAALMDASWAPPPTGRPGEAAAEGEGVSGQRSGR